MKNILILVLGVLCLILILDETCVIRIFNMPCECINDTTDVPDSALVKIPLACNDDARYAVDTNTGSNGGRLITSADVQTLAKNFRDVNTNTSNKGVFISKQAIDIMFAKNLTANGLACYFAYDGNTDKKATLIFEPMTSESFLVEGLTSMFNRTEPLMFVAESMCPDDCGPDAPAE